MTGDKVEGTQPSHPLEDYVGVYGRPGYTDVTITLEDGALRLSFIGTDVELAHFHYDTFLLSGVMGELPSGIPGALLRRGSRRQDRGSSPCPL